VTDWFSYDTVAARYDGACRGRFQETARLLSGRLSVPPPASVLDMGTGTGVVLHALGPAAALTGCDRSAGMLHVARARVPAARLVQADATTLPFRDASFDAVSASFVLSHLDDHETALAEAHRVLKHGGRFAMTSWAADSDPSAEAWRELLADAVPREVLKAAVSRVLPREAQLDSAPAVEDGLRDAGFAGVEVVSETLRYAVSVDGFLEDREISAAGRFARHTLGAEAWSRWCAHARDELVRRLGPTFECAHRVLIGLGTRGPR
jgi:ubiquinone/menaquinone biosynthesis C-methylase UbiE